jgi:hypothetical protein
MPAPIAPTSTPKASPVAPGQHVATLAFRSADGAITYDQPVVATEAPTGTGFAFGGYPKVEDAIADARATSSASDRAYGVFKMPRGLFGMAGLEFAEAGAATTGPPPPQGIEPGAAARLAVSNLGWAPDVTATSAKRATDALLTIVDGDATIDVQAQKPIAPLNLSGDDGMLLGN